MDANEWDHRYDTAAYVWHTEPNQFLPALIDDLAPGRALDLACGEGRNAVWLARRGWSVTAVDFSEVGIEKGRRLAAESDVDVEWVVADITTWTGRSETYDLVIIFYVQLPADERAAMLGTAATALAPGGRFVMVAHDLSNLDDGIGGPQDPTVLPTPELIRVDLMSGGPADLVIDRAELISRAVETETDDGTKQAIDCLVVAHRG
ncbi:MAG: class I SAM-dependent methyltransferase [Acidimicrobiia bacterium]|nr:class I SAM-dependent methyltransferase [Acidimicrobiia bacterium]